MSGRARLPGGQPCKASQKRTRRSGPVPVRVTPTSRLGDRVRWGERFGSTVRSSGTSMTTFTLRLGLSNAPIGCGSLI